MRQAFRAFVFVGGAVRGVAVALQMSRNGMPTTLRVVFAGGELPAHLGEPMQGCAGAAARDLGRCECVGWS